MKRRDFLRALWLTIAAVFAGVPVAQAWARAVADADARRRELILAQMQYQAGECFRAMQRKHEMQWSDA